MTNTLQLYFRYIGISIRSQMQYKASFVMSAAGHALMTFIEFLAIWALFERFGTLEGWSLPEVAMFYGMVSTAFAIAEAVARGFDIFPGMVKSGDFDRLLLRPRGTVFQVMAQEIQLMRVGRFTQGMAVLLWAVSVLDVTWTVPRILLMTGSILGGACIFSGFFILQATMSFWTIETLEIINTITYGGVETAQFPLVIYKDWFRKFFTYVVPLACINYFPALAILEKENPLGIPGIVQWMSPLLGFAFLLVTLWIWRFGVRHYKSTGS